MSDRIQDGFRAKLRRQILDGLDSISGNMLSLPLLLTLTNLHLREKATLDGFCKELAELEQRGFIVVLREGPLSRECKIRITAAGRAALAEVKS